jgi:transcriptional regulator with XRE-family HTH domain
VSEITRSHSADKSIWRSFADRAYRHAYAAAHVGDFLAMQIQAMRMRRNMTQTDLANRLGAGGQPKISKLETSCEGVNLATLQRVAEAFDVGLIVKFAPFSEIARESLSAQADKYIPSYSEESEDAIRNPSVTFVTQATRTFEIALEGGSEPQGGYIRMFDEAGSSSAAEAVPV